MGFAVAAEAARRGHDVTLIAGPVALKTPKGVKRIDVVSAREMLKASLEAIENLEFDNVAKSGTEGRGRPYRRGLRDWRWPVAVCYRACRRGGDGTVTFACPSQTLPHNLEFRIGNEGNSTIPNSSFLVHRSPVAFISTAAVADWRPAKCATSKLKKHQMSGTLKLVRNPDILKTLARKVGVASRSPKNGDAQSSLQLPLQLQTPTPTHLIGFAAETDDVLAEASRKCREKGLSFIVANDVTEKGSGFGTDTNRVTFVFPDGTLKRHPLMSKRRVAGAIIREIEGLPR